MLWREDLCKLAVRTSTWVRGSWIVALGEGVVVCVCCTVVTSECWTIAVASEIVCCTSGVIISTYSESRANCSCCCWLSCATWITWVGDSLYMCIQCCGCRNNSLRCYLLWCFKHSRRANTRWIFLTRHPTKFGKWYLLLSLDSIFFNFIDVLSRYSHRQDETSWPIFWQWVQKSRSNSYATFALKEKPSLSTIISWFFFIR